MYIKCIILSDLHNPSSLSSCISIWSTQPLLLVIMHFYLIYTTPPPCHHAFLSDLHNPSSLSSCISIWSTQPLLLVIMYFYLICTGVFCSFLFLRHLFTIVAPVLIFIFLCALIYLMIFHATVSAIGDIHVISYCYAGSDNKWLTTVIVQVKVGLGLVNPGHQLSQVSEVGHHWSLGLWDNRGSRHHQTHIILLKMRTNYRLVQKCENKPH